MLWDVIKYSNTTSSCFDVDEFTRNGNLIALLLTGHSILIGEMDFGDGFFHYRIDIGSCTSNNVRMCGKTHFHEHFDGIKLCDNRQTTDNELSIYIYISLLNGERRIPQRLLSTVKSYIFPLHVWWIGDEKLWGSRNYSVIHSREKTCSHRYFSFDDG